MGNQTDNGLLSHYQMHFLVTVGLKILKKSISYKKSKRTDILSHKVIKGKIKEGRLRLDVTTL